MKKILVIIFLTYYISVSIAQPSIGWQKCLGGSETEWGLAGLQTADGGYLILNSTGSTDGDVLGMHGSSDAWLVRLDSMGNILWKKCYGGTDIDALVSIMPYDQNYFLVGGTSSNDGDVSGNHGNQDAWIIKIDSSGNILWQKCFGGTNVDAFNTILRVFNNSLVVGGYTKSNDGDVSGNHSSPAYDDSWVVNIDTAGNIIWQTCIGGTNEEWAKAICQLPDSGFMFVGQTSSDDGNVSGNHGGTNDAWVFKLNSSGNLIWQKCFGGSMSDLFVTSKQLQNGNLAMIGSTNSTDFDVSGNHGNGDFWLVKIDLTGNLLFQKCLGGSNIDTGEDFFETNDGGFIICGQTVSTDGDVMANYGNTDCWLLKTDSSGIVEWGKNYGGTGHEDFRQTFPTSNNSLIALGHTMSNDFDVSGNHSSFLKLDSWVVKFDSLPLTILKDEMKSLRDYLILSPNPTSGKLKIQNEGLRIESIQVFNLFGEEVLEATATNEIDLIDQPPGIYFIRLQSEGKIHSAKVVRQ